MRKKDLYMICVFASFDALFIAKMLLLVTLLCTVPFSAQNDPCSVTFGHEGTFDGFYHAIHIEPNTYVIPVNRTRPRLNFASDTSLYLSTIFGGNAPPYIRLQCQSKYPIDFDFEGPAALDFVTVTRGHYWDYNYDEEPEDAEEELIEEMDQKKKEKIVVPQQAYSLYAEILLTPEATGKYIVFSESNKMDNLSYVVFPERARKPFLVGRSPLEALSSADGVVLPCVTTNYNSTLNLFIKNKDSDAWVKVNARRVKEQGFLVTDTPALYKCSTGDERDSDSLEVHVKPQTKDNSRLSIRVNGDTVTCTSTSNETPLILASVYTRNPTESRILRKCLDKSGTFCGKHTYHPRINRISITAVQLQLRDLYSSGVLHCRQLDIHVGTEYFIGLDGRIYTDWRVALPEALVFPTWTPNITKEMTTGIPYQFSCNFVPSLFLSVQVNIKLKNGSLTHPAIGIGVHHIYTVYVSVDMQEITCSGNLFSPNQFVNTSLLMQVKEKACATGHVRCLSGQCVFEEDRCDGVNNCDDFSDELHCAGQKCKSGLFQCSSGQCLEQHRVCDNYADCTEDKLDEKRETCWAKNCSSEEFKCETGQCVPLYTVHDGINSCADSSDENLNFLKKFIPRIVNASNAVTFVPNTMRELVCKVDALPDTHTLNPRFEWWFKSKNITDPDRLWNAASKSLLKFVNVNAEDEGHYKCLAINSLGQSEHTTLVTLVTKKEPKMGKKVPTRTPEHLQEPRNLSPPKQQPSSSSGSSSTVSVILILLGLLTVCLLVGGVYWKFYRRPNTPALTRMNEEDQIVFANMN